MHEFELGTKVKCRVTGFKGIIVGRNEWINGCKQYLVKPKIDKSGKLVDGEWMDEEQLELNGKGIKISVEPTGGPPKDNRQRSN